MPIARLAHLAGIWHARVNDAKGAAAAPLQDAMSSAPRAAASVPSWSTPASASCASIALRRCRSLAPVDDLKTTVWWFVAVPLAFAAVTVPFMLRDGEHAGQTLGKQLFGLRVIDDSHGVVSPRPRDRARAAREGAVRDGLGLSDLHPRDRQRGWSAFDPERRGLQDRATGTRVVRAPRPVSEPAPPPLVADLHVHYPMHVLSGDRDVTLGRMVRIRRREGVGDKFRGAVLALASRLLNYRSWDAGPRVTVDFLAAGGVRVALSVLYSPFDEMDLDERYGALPEPGYFARLLEQLEQVEAEVAGHAGATIVHDDRRARPRARRRRSSASCTASRAASTSARPRPTSTPTSRRSPGAASPT